MTTLSWKDIKAATEPAAEQAPRDTLLATVTKLNARASAAEKRAEFWEDRCLRAEQVTESTVAERDGAEREVESLRAMLEANALAIQNAERRVAELLAANSRLVADRRDADQAAEKAMERWEDTLDVLHEVIKQRNAAEGAVFALANGKTWNPNTVADAAKRHQERSEAAKTAKSLQNAIARH